MRPISLVFYVLLNLPSLLSQADPIAKDILNKVFSNTYVYVRSGSSTRSIGFDPASDINDIFSKISKDINQYPFMKDKFKKGIDIYINQDLVSQVEFSKAQYNELLDFQKTLEAKNLNNKDFEEMEKYFKLFLKERRKLKKERYRLKILAKAIQIQLKENVDIKIPLHKIHIHTIDVKPKKNTVRIKQDPQTTKKNILWRAPGTFTTVAFIIRDALHAAISPIRAVSSAVLTIAVNVGFSVYSASLLNINRKLSKYGRWAKMLFSIAQARLIELLYRSVGRGFEDMKFFENGFGVKLVLNTIDTMAGTFKKDGLNTLVDKGYMSTNDAGVLESALRNLSPIAQVATANTGNPMWDTIYLFTLITKLVIIKMGTWTVSKLLPPQTRLILLSLGQEFFQYSDTEKERVLKNFLAEHGFRISKYFVKMPQLPVQEKNIKETFLEYNLIIAKKFMPDILQHISTLEDSFDKDIDYNKLLLAENFGLIPTLAQDIRQLALSNAEIKRDEFFPKNNYIPEDLSIPIEILVRHLETFNNIEKLLVLLKPSSSPEIQKNIGIIEKAITSTKNTLNNSIETIYNKEKYTEDDLKYIEYIYKNTDNALSYKQLIKLGSILNITGCTYRLKLFNAFLSAL